MHLKEQWIREGFEISAEDMELLKHFKHIESYGKSGGFPVYGGKL